MKLSRLFETVQKASEVVALTEGSSGSPLKEALEDLIVLTPSGIKWALVGGLAVGFHARPRGTQDVDIMLASEGEIDEIARVLGDKFKKIRPHSLEHKRTGVEIELLTPEFLKIPEAVIQNIIETSEVHNGVPVASRSGIVAAKLFRRSYQDKADIEAIIRTGGPVDLSEFDLSPEQLSTYEQIKREVIGHS